MADMVNVRYTAGRAEVRIGERVLEVASQDDNTRTSACPIELISAALGS